MDLPPLPSFVDSILGILEVVQDIRRLENNQASALDLYVVPLPPFTDCWFIVQYYLAMYDEPVCQLISRYNYRTLQIYPDTIHYVLFNQRNILFIQIPMCFHNVKGFIQMRTIFVSCNRRFVSFDQVNANPLFLNGII